MKIQIDYFPYADKSIPCGAFTEHEGEKINGFGATWQQAKERLLENLQAKLSVTVPKREIVDLPEPDDIFGTIPDFPGEIEELQGNPHEFGDSN